MGRQRRWHRGEPLHVLGNQQWLVCNQMDILGRALGARLAGGAGLVVADPHKQGGIPGLQRDRVVYGRVEGHLRIRFDGRNSQHMG